MGRLNNIAKIWQRLASPSGGWGVFVLALLLLAGTRYAHAQNTSGSPFYDSEHLYRITMDNTANGVQWQLYEGSLGGTVTNLGAQAFVDTSVVSGNAEIEIRFVEAIFEASPTWFLVYSETNAAGSCVARRSLQINPVDNNFFLSVAQYDTTCNSYSGRVWPNTVDDISDADSLNTVDFTVTMNKPDNFHTDGWSFDGKVTLVVAGPNTLQNGMNILATSLRGGACSFTGNSGNFHLSVNGPVDLDQTTDEVTITVEVLGDVTSDFEVQLIISNGEAFSGSSSYTVTTTDNGSGNKQIRKYILGIPNTSLISISP